MTGEFQLRLVPVCVRVALKQHTDDSREKMKIANNQRSAGHIRAPDQSLDDVGAEPGTGLMSDVLGCCSDVAADVAAVSRQTVGRPSVSLLLRGLFPRRRRLPPARSLHRYALQGRVPTAASPAGGQTAVTLQFLTEPPN